MRRYDIHGRLLEDTEPDAACYFTRFEDAQAEIATLESVNEKWCNTISRLRDELTAANLERDALAKALNPRLWTRAQSDAWHRAIPDLYKAFESLRSANSATEGQS